MGEVRVTIPAERLEAFRMAAISEVKFSAGWVADMQRALAERYVKEGGKLEPNDLGDLRSSSCGLMQDVNLLEQLAAAPNEGPVEVRGEDQALAHVAEAMADKVCAPVVAQEVNCSPIERQHVGKIHEALDGVRWAADLAARMHAELEGQHDDARGRTRRLGTRVRRCCQRCEGSASRDSEARASHAARAARG
ncbi:MAG: hypothetical protein H0W09_06895 [Solirubrobacterales bacterium]|nr:hypothetical protein [Solirubrobacterales bacterium]